jgi:hypothetical protein
MSAKESAKAEAQRAWDQKIEICGLRARRALDRLDLDDPDDEAEEIPAA